MNSEWPLIELNEVAVSINTGLDAIRRAPIVDRKTDLRCLRIQDISKNKPITEWGYTQTKDSDYEKYRLIKDDIIMARTCSTGINYLVKEDLPAVFNNGLARLRFDLERVYPPFMYYVFQSRSFVDYINGISGGTSVQLNMKVGDLAKYEFRLPNFEAQRSIAEKLGEIDDKIQLNSQTSQTLEQIAQAIFKSWFVDFEPVKAKIRAREKWLQNHPDSFAATPPSQGVELTDSPPAKGEYAEGGRGLNNLKHLKMFRTKLRNKLTPAEAKLWTYLKNKQLKGRKFRRQHSVGNYILDFYCPAEKLAIELDGEVHNSETQAVYDQERSLFLAHYGIKVLRFENNVVFENPEGLLSKVQEHFNHPAPDGAPLLEKVNHPAPDGAPLLEKVNHPAPDGAPLLEKEGSLEEAMNLAAMSVISGKDEAVLKQLQAGRPEAYAKLKQTAALFPSAMQESELGEIPKGWAVDPLGKYIDIKRGGSPRPIKDFIVPQGYPWTKIADATANNNPYIFKTNEFIKKEGLRKTVLLKKGTLILSNSATPGLPRFLDIDACIHDGWLHFPKKERFTDSYLYFLFLEIRQDLVMQGNGSVFTNLKTDILRNQPVTVPPVNLINAFNVVAGSTLELIKNKSRENNKLSETRDSLLPKLLSGELEMV